MEVLRKGSTGANVKKLQSALNWAGASLEVDGKYGPATEKAVKSFQQENGLIVDGIAGPETWSKLKTLYYASVGEKFCKAMEDVDNLSSVADLLGVI